MQRFQKIFGTVKYAKRYRNGEKVFQLRSSKDGGAYVFVDDGPFGDDMFTLPPNGRRQDLIKKLRQQNDDGVPLWYSDFAEDIAVYDYISGQLVRPSKLTAEISALQSAYKKHIAEVDAMSKGTESKARKEAAKATADELMAVLSARASTDGTGKVGRVGK